MLNKILAFIRQQNLVESGDRVICAVSGGSDSLALLFALYLLKDNLNIQLAAAHFNHLYRGPEGYRDEDFVREFCERYDIPLTVGRGEVVPGKKGLEAAARDARYAFLRGLPGKIATAHTADDNAETVLMHIVRGTGLKGLGGIAPVNGNVIRPMLTVTQQEVEEFCAEWSLDFLTDSTNPTDKFLRNRLRQDEDCLAQMSEPEAMDVEALRGMHPALRSRALEAFLKRSGVREPEASHIAQAESLVFSDKPSAFAEFPGGVTVARNYNALEVRQEVQALPAVELPIPGSVVWGDYRITTSEAGEGLLLYPDGPITARSRVSGDTIRLSGGTKPLKKLFIDRKIPAPQRSRIPVLADGRGVLAVYGFGTNLEREDGEKSPIRVKIEKLPHREEKENA